MFPQSRKKLGFEIELVDGNMAETVHSSAGESSLVIGLNSGTSMDGVDAVLLKISERNKELVFCSFVFCC